MGGPFARRWLLLPLAGLLLGGLTCAPPRRPGSVPRSAASAAPAPATATSRGLHFDVGAVDRRVDPCRDFYDFACGGWRATHPIPPDQTSWSRYAEMRALNLTHERDIVEGAARDGAKAGAAEQRIGAYWAACMDEPGIEARGLAPLREILSRIDAIRSGRDALGVIAELQAHAIDAVFAAYADTDPGDAHRVALWIDTGELGLPSPSDYTGDDDPPGARARYVEHVTRLFRLLGAPAGEAARSASRTLAFETALARKALSAVDERHLDARDHPMTVDALVARYPAIDWRTHLQAIGLPHVERVNVAQPAWLDAVTAALSSPDLEGVRGYLRMLVAGAFATMLPRAIRDEQFDFGERILRGAREEPPRWKQCLRLVDRDVGDDVGRVFLARYLDDAARARVRRMVSALLAAYGADIASSDWLGPSARAAAEAKLARILVVIGASNRPRSFDGLRVVRDDAFGNAWRARAAAATREWATVDRPADREKFFDALPQETDAFGSKPLNAVGLTAGFLQPPTFDPTMDDAVNFGGLGSVIGHELTHRFDDEGRRFDADGNLRSWWSPDDVKRFEARAGCFVDEYSRFHAEDGTPLDGKLTLGENIADNGGIRLSYAALRPSDTGPRVDGFTPAQRFFLAWGQIRCENVTPEAARRMAKTNPHAPGRWRVDGVVANMPEFARAFACQPGAPMAPRDRCVLW